MGVVHANMCTADDDGIPLSKNFRTWFDKDHINHFSRVSKGVARNRSDALLQNAKKFKDPELFYLCGVIFERGYGCRKNFQRALKYYRLSADKNYVHAIERIGLCYKNGIGVEMNEDLAFKYYKRGAEEGSVNSMKRLGSFYATGFGTEVDHTLAKYWKERAKDEQELDAHFQSNLRKDQKLSKTLSWKDAKKSPHSSPSHSPSRGDSNRKNEEGSDEDLHFVGRSGSFSDDEEDTDDSSSSNEDEYHSRSLSPIHNEKEYSSSSPSSEGGGSRMPSSLPFPASVSASPRSQENAKFGSESLLMNPNLRRTQSVNSIVKGKNNTNLPPLTSGDKGDSHQMVLESEENIVILPPIERKKQSEQDGERRSVGGNDENKKTTGRVRSSTLGANHNFVGERFSHIKEERRRRNSLSSNISVTVRQLKEERDRFQRLLEEERFAHIRTQTLLKNVRGDLYSARKRLWKAENQRGADFLLIQQMKREEKRRKEKEMLKRKKLLKKQKNKSKKEKGNIIQEQQRHQEPHQNEPSHHRSKSVTSEDEMVDDKNPSPVFEDSNETNIIIIHHKEGDDGEEDYQNGEQMS